MLTPRPIRRGATATEEGAPCSIRAIIDDEPRRRTEAGVKPNRPRLGGNAVAAPRLVAPLLLLTFELALDVDAVGRLCAACDGKATTGGVEADGVVGKPSGFFRLKKLAILRTCPTFIFFEQLDISLTSQRGRILRRFHRCR